MALVSLLNLKCHGYFKFIPILKYYKYLQWQNKLNSFVSVDADKE